MRTTKIGRTAQIVTGLSAMALTLSACAGAASGGGDDEAVKLRIAHVLPPGGSQSDLIDWFAEEMGSRTDGAVEVEITYSGGLLSATDMVNGLKAGRAEGGEVVPAYYPAELPLNNVNMVPLAGANQGERLLAFQDMAENNEKWAAELEAQELKLVGYLPNNASAVAFDAEVTSLADVKGLKVRAPAQPQADVWKALGAEPVFMATEEVYESLERGIVNGVTYPFDTQIANGITDVAKTMTADVGESGGAIFALSQRAYDDLSQEGKDAFEEIQGEWYEKADELLSKYDEESCDTFLNEDKGTVVQWNDEDQQKINDAVEKLAKKPWQDEVAKTLDAATADEVWNEFMGAIEANAGESNYTNGLATCGQ
jgi:TRAP-type C4-dicarboxylate transport system substrate-binding protein